MSNLLAKRGVVSIHSVLLFVVFFGRFNGILYESNVCFSGLIILSLMGIISLWRTKQHAIPYLSWMICFLLMYIVSAAWAENRTTVITNFIATLGRMIIVLYIFLALGNKSTRCMALKTFIYAVALNGVFILIVYGPHALIETRINERNIKNWNSNSIGMSSAVAIISDSILYRILMGKSKKRRIFDIIVVGFLFVIAFMSGSKKTILIIVVYFGLSYFFEHRNKLGSVILIILCLCTGYIVLISVPFLYDMIGGRIQSLIQGVESLFELSSITEQSLLKSALNSSDRTRINFIALGLQWISEKPILGHGMANYIYLFAQGHSRGFYSHNNYIEIGVGLGLAGLLLYYSIYVFVIKRSFPYSYKSKYRRASTVIVILILVLDFGLVSYLELEVQYLIALSYTMCYCNDMSHYK